MARTHVRVPNRLDRRSANWGIRPRSGYVLLQALVGLLVMGMFTSLAVDIGLFYVAKAELQRAADAASLAGVAKLRDNDVSGAVQTATDYAIANPVCGEPLVPAAIEVTTGSWNSGTFLPGGTPTDAIRVRLKRGSSAGNPVRLFFGQFVGISTVDMAATSISRVERADTYNLVGIQKASFGSISVLAQIKGRLVSNGDISVGHPLGIGVTVQGDVRSFGGIIKRGALASITGDTDSLPEALHYPSVRLPAANDNSQIGAYLNLWNDFTAIGLASIPAGTYVVRDLNLVATTSLQLSGPVTFYVTRNCNIAGSVTLLGSTNFSSSNFKVRVVPGGYVLFLASLLTPLNMDLYAPDSDIVVAVSVNAYKGRLIGKTLAILLPTLGSFTEELDLEDPLGATAVQSLIQ